MLDQNEIKKYIRNKVKCEILNIENEKCKEEGKEFIENGIVRLKIKYTEKSKVNFLLQLRTLVFSIFKQKKYIKEK